MNFKNNVKSIALWLMAGLFLFALFTFFKRNMKNDRILVSLSDFISIIERKEFKEVILKEQELEGVSVYDKKLYTYTPPFFNPINILKENKISFRSVLPDTSSFTFLALLQIFLPLIFIGGTWFFFFRQVQSSNGRALGFGRARVKLSDPQKNPITFDDVEGIEEAKEDLKEVVDFLREPKKFQTIGARIPKGILLVGPPGTGKTLLARAVAGEAGVPFFSISGSDFVEMFVGVGASRVRDLFSQAKQHAPCIIFIDEIDAVGRNRGSSGLGGGHDEREQTLNQLLVEMDGFDPKEEVIIIAATNRSDVLDPALLRPGRFDRRISVDLPDLKGREKIVMVHLKKVLCSKEVSPFLIAKGTPGFSGADLANLVNEAALRAASQNKKIAEPQDFEASRDKIIMGPERRSMIMTEEEKKITAYHEAGHAVVAYHSPHSDPIHKATIIPRGGALGMVVRFPEGDRVSISRQRLMDDIAVALAGRLAEEIIFGHHKVTTGASSDFKFVTHLARRMVLEWGMSDALGTLSYVGAEQTPWAGRAQDFSEDIMKMVDQEIRKIVDQAHEQASHILTHYPHHLELMASYLLEHETLTGEEIRTLLTEGKLEKNLPSSPPSKRSRSSSKEKKKTVSEEGGSIEPPLLASSKET